MRILIMNWRDPMNPKSGGAETVTFVHAKKWMEAGHKITWLSTTFEASKKIEYADGLKVVRIGGVLSQFVLFPLYYLRNRSSIDFVIDEIHGLPHLTPLFVNKKKLAFIHEVAKDIWDVMFPFPFSTIGIVLERISFLVYRDIPFMTVSESTKLELNKLGIKNVTVIHNGVDPLSVNGEKEKNPTFVFISRLVKMKGIEDVLEAFYLIIQRKSNSRLWIIGSGDHRYMIELKEKVRKLNLESYVSFFGKVSEKEKYSLLKKAHILLHASVKEGWGLVVVEAASQGTPAVVYDVPGLRDSVKNGETGVIVKSNKPSSLCEESLLLIDDKVRYEKFQRNSIKWSKSLTWDKSTEKSLRLIESI